MFMALVVAILTISIITGCFGTNTNNPSKNPGTPPPEVTTYAADWPLPNHDYRNTRETTTSSITSSNVNQLSVAWMYNISASGAFGALPTIPLILGDTVYFHDIDANIHAVDLNTGARKWMKMYNSQGLEGPFGVAIGYGKIFMQKDNYEFMALNLTTGAELWSTQINNVNTTGIDIQPQVYDGLVFTSTVPGTGDIFYAGGGMGKLFALDVNNGSIVWTFNTVKDGDLWGHPEVNSGGGAWYTPPVDTKTGMMYWSIANPAPFSGTSEYPNGESFGYNTLYTDSVLAIDHNTGELQWYNQVLQHDIQDHDLQICGILVDNVTASGKTHDVVIVSGKMGKVYSVDRDTGNLLWAVPVGEHTPNDQWDNFPDTSNKSEFRVVAPSVIGGVETPMAYSDGIIYVPVEDLSNPWNSTSPLFNIDFTNGKGELVALDVRSGNTKWAQYFDPGVNVGGATVVNDLVFTATYNGVIYAFDKKTGEKMFEYQASGGINGQPAVAGDTIVFPVGVSQTPHLLALSLSGTGGQQTPQIMITQPSSGSTITGNNVTVKVHVSNFDLVDKLGQSNVAGQGHIHYFLDVQPPTTPGQPATTAQGTFVATTNTSYTWTNLSPGQHTFAVELVNNDHTPLEPAVTASVTVTLQEQSGGGGGASTTIALSAQNIAFNLSTITVPAGAQITINFQNNDAGIPHNFAVYDTSAASHTIFKGDIITGVSSTTYTFTAPSTPGTYFFRCDVHPNQMYGDFIVQ